MRDEDFILGKFDNTSESCVQKSIHHCLAMIAPFVCDTICYGSMKRNIEGEEQFYEFMISLYYDMYREPEKFIVFAQPYEKYMAERTEKKDFVKKEKEHATDSRESTLRNVFQQAIQFYALFFYNLGIQDSILQQDTGHLIISKENYDIVLQKMERIHESFRNTKRYQVLAEMGVHIDDFLDHAETSNDSLSTSHVEVWIQGYQKAMFGLKYLCDAPDSKFKWMNYLRIDYQNAYEKAPTVKSICDTLPIESVTVIDKLEEILKDLKPKSKLRPLRGIVSDFRWKVEYSVKGKNVCGFYADRDYFMLCIYFNDFRNITEFAKVLDSEDHTLFEWFQAQFPERLCKCPYNRRVFFKEEPRRICGLSNRAEVMHPTPEDTEKALYIMKKFRGL